MLGKSFFPTCALVEQRKWARTFLPMPMQKHYVV